MYRDTIDLVMAARITDGEYHALSELRYLIRRFLQEGDATARQAGLEPQQYLLLLVFADCSRGGKPASARWRIGWRCAITATVELIDRMEAHGFVKRTRGREDRRQVLVSLQPRGEKLLEKVVAQRIVELRSHGRALVNPSEDCWNRGPQRRRRSGEMRED